MKYACQVYTHTVYETHMDKNLMVGWLPLPSQILCTIVKKRVNKIVIGKKKKIILEYFTLL